MGLIRSVINGTVQRARNSNNEQGDDTKNTHSRGPLPPGPCERRQMRHNWVEQKIAGSGKSKASQQQQVLLWAYLNCTAFGPEQINLCGRLPKFLTSTRPVRLQWTVRCTQRAFQPVGTGHCLHRSHAANQI
ncbi:hypothetical protein WJX82_011355 [Trebouxia sp. C0006]